MTQFSPYWWQDQLQYSNSDDVPKKSDIVIVGAGYTGLSAALKLLQPSENHSVFEKTPLFTRPYYYGRPWFLSFVSAIFRGYDLLDNYRRKRSLKKI